MRGFAATAAILLLAATAGAAPIITFDFESEPVDSSQNGSLTSLVMTQSGLTITITRSTGVAFDVLNPVAGGFPNAYPPSWGSQALSPFFDPSMNDFFIASFSESVAWVSMESGDFGGDVGDVIYLEAFSNNDGTGPLLPVNVNTDSVNWGANNFNLSGAGSPPVTVSVGDPLAPKVINSVAFRGGTPGFENSAYFDNIAVVIPEPSTALLLGLGLTGLAVGGRKRPRSSRQLPVA